MNITKSYTMKIWFVLLVIMINSYLIANGQDRTRKLNNLGLMAELTFVKSVSENYALGILNDSLVSDSSKKEIIRKYDQLKTSYNQIIIQLIADMKSKNKLNTYKKLNTLYFNDDINNIEADNLSKKIGAYIKNLKEANEFFVALKNYAPPKPSQPDAAATKGFLPVTASVEELTGLLTFVTSVIKDIRESREKKVDKICAMLDNLLLNNLPAFKKAGETSTLK